MKKGLYQCPQCLQWWGWQCRDSTAHLQRKCRKCGKKVRAQLERHWMGRGRPRGWTMLHRPSHTSDQALTGECRTRNRRIRQQAQARSARAKRIAWTRKSSEED